MPAKIDISGQRFGRLTVVCEAGRKGGQVTWICRCDCGNEHIAKGRDLRFGDVFNQTTGSTLLAQGYIRFGKPCEKGAQTQTILAGEYTAEKGSKSVTSG